MLFQVEITMMRFSLCIVLSLFSLVSFVSDVAAQQPPRAIVNITGQLYRAQNNNHFTVFLVTPEGIVMSDPINRDFGRWLKGEFASRFKVPVRYILYTHHDWDHASGGVVFADTAEFVGHENMLTAIAPPAGKPSLTPEAMKMDANRNGLVERAEASGGLADMFALYDYDRDNLLSGAEIARGSVSDVHPPTTTYSGRHTVTLGGKRIEMIHLGMLTLTTASCCIFPTSARSSALTSCRCAAFRPAGPDGRAWINALTIINSLDFEHALTGHALAGTKKDAADLLRYLEDVSNGVASGIAAGKSLAEIQKTLTLDAYKRFERWDTIREAHIAAVSSNRWDPPWSNDPISVNSPGRGSALRIAVRFGRTL